jgi:hypothetical protein
MIWNVRKVDRADDLVLEEFRLHKADTDGAAAAIVAAASEHIRDPVPLLTSIEDPCDVATLRTVVGGAADGDDPRRDAALGALVASWKPVKRYRARIAARSRAAPSASFRLAVTESGINDEDVAPPSAWVGERTAGEPIGLLLIGVPEGTHAGLLVLVGRDNAGPVASRRDRAGWPLPLSHDLGVRVYESNTEVSRPQGQLRGGATLAASRTSANDPPTCGPRASIEKCRIPLS